MFDYSFINASNLQTTCRGCLKIGDDVRSMSLEEQNLYLRFVKVSNADIGMSICVLCAHLLRKLSKFLYQCQESCDILSNILLEDTKPNVYIPRTTVHNLSTTEPQISEYCNTYYEYTPELVTFDDGSVFDDEDVPLVLLKSEDSVGNDRVKKKKRSKKKSIKIEENELPPIKIEDLKSESLNPTEDKKVKFKKPKKELREGFSSRMVQETEEYVVIKLTSEQVLQEMHERSKSEEYQRTLFKCDKCVKGFNFEDVLRTHMEKHSMENGSFQCTICTQYCPSVVSLRGHMKSHTTRYKCKVCGCVRQSRQHLLEHHSSHTAASPSYSCHHCQFTTTKRTSMQRHVKSHGARPQHSCHQCGKLFRSLETLRVHTMRHDKSKRLQCSECVRVFIYPSLLHRHVQAVHVRKDYYCVECDVEFKSRENLRLHFKKAKRHKDSSSYQYESSMRFSNTSRGHATTRAEQRQNSRARKGLLEKTDEAPILHDKMHKKIDVPMLSEIPQPTLLES